MNEIIREPTAEDRARLNRDFLVNFCRIRSKHQALDKLVADNNDFPELLIRKQFFDCGWKKEYFCL